MFARKKMTGENPPASFRSYLSGILIGHEIKGAMDIFGKDIPLTLVADLGPKCDLYRHTFACFNWPIASELLAEELLLRGLGANWRRFK